MTQAEIKFATGHAIGHARNLILMVGGNRNENHKSGH